MSLANYISRLEGQEQEKKATKTLSELQDFFWAQIRSVFGSVALKPKSSDPLNGQMVFSHDRLNIEVLCYLRVVNGKILLSISLNGKNLEDIIINDEIAMTHFIVKDSGFSSTSLKQAIDFIFAVAD